MMYFDLSFNKTATALILTLLLVLSVGLTFDYKNTHFGGLRLPFALARIMEQQSLRLLYGMRGLYENGTLLAAVGFNELATEKVENNKTAQAVPVLIYHALVKETGPHNMTRETFSEQMFALKKAGWNTVTLKQFEEFMRGERSLPEKSFVLTFDDGAKNSYYSVDPVLEATGFTAVSFILPKYSAHEGTFYYLSEGEIKTMLKSGRWEIQSHGKDSHEFFPIDEAGTEGPALANRLWLPDQQRIETEEEYRTRVTADLRDSKNDIESAFGVEVNAFAFPFGEYGQLHTNYPDASRVVAEASSKIYDYTFYQTWEGEGFSFNYPTTHPGMVRIRRIGPLPPWSGEHLVDVLESGLPKERNFSDSFETDTGWFANWGSYSIEEGVLHLETKPEQTGTAVVLDGTRNWEDYEFTATVTSPEQTGVLLWARFKDNDNNAACNFGNGFTHVEETLDGNRRVIQGNRNPSIEIPEGPFTVGIKVEDRTVTCFMNGKEITSSTFLDETLSQGGIGIKIWDAAVGKSKLLVDEIQVVGTTATTTSP